MAFQVGTQVRPELGRADVSGFAKAGMITGQALAGLGEDIGKAVTKYQVDKQNAEDRKLRYETILPYLTAQFGAEEGEKMSKSFSKDAVTTSKIINLAGLQQEQNALNAAIAAGSKEKEFDQGAALSAYQENRGQNLPGVLKLMESMGGPTQAELDQAAAERAKLQAETAKLEAEAAAIGKPQTMKPSERMRLIETKVGDVTFGQYLQELMQTKAIKGGELHKRGLLNFDEDQIAAFDDFLRQYPEFLKDMPQVVQDYYSTQAGSANIMTLPDGTTVQISPQ